MQVINCRTRGNEPPFEPIVQSKNLSSALEHLLVYELGFGGKITHLEENKVTVMTRVMNCIDITTFEWTAEEKEIVYDVISTWVVIKEATQSTVIQDALVDKVMKITNGNPLMVKLGADHIMGELPVKATLLQLIGSETHTPELKKLNNKDLFTIFDLVYLEKQSIDEVLELVH